MSRARIISANASRERRTYVVGGGLPRHAHARRHMIVVETVSEGTGNEVSPRATSYPRIGQGQEQVKRGFGGSSRRRYSDEGTAS